MATEIKEKQKFELGELPTQTKIVFVDTEQNKAYSLEEAILLILNKICK
jgi:hypothetical protein